MQRRPFVLIPLAIGAWLWVAAIVAAPALAAAPATTGPHFAAGMYLGGALICHQRPERSFHLAGAQLPVCARCIGLYLGGALGVLAWAAIAGVRAQSRTRARAVIATPARLRRLLLVVALPTMISVATAMVGIWDGANITRALFAVPLGAGIGAVIAAAAAGDLR